MKDLYNHSKNVALTMNEAKTKLITNSTEEEIKANHIITEYTQDYLWLGQTVPFLNTQDKEEILDNNNVQ